jgi:hypothetical protein
MDDPILIWATVVQAAATVVGFMFVGWQALELKQTIRGDAHDSLYSHYAGVITMLAAKPYLHPYLYDNKPIGEGDPEHPNLRQEMDLVSESILALIEHAVMYRKELPDDAWNNCWLPYARERFKTSGELSRFFDANKHWYAKSLRDVFENCPAILRTSHKAETRVRARP